MPRYTREERRKLRALKRLSSARDSEFEGFITHSTLYHRVYEGYSERLVPNENGRGTHIERVYVGNYYVRSASALSLKRSKVIYSLLFLLGTLCAVFAFSRPTGFNSVWYGVLPMFALLILLALFLYELVGCLPAPERMELYHYNAFGRLMKSAFRIALIAFGYALLSVVYRIVTPGAIGTLLVALGAALAGGAFLSLFFLERNSEYDTIENPVSCEQDAVVIG